MTYDILNIKYVNGVNMVLFIHYHAHFYHAIFVFYQQRNRLWPKVSPQKWYQANGDKMKKK